MYQMRVILIIFRLRIYKVFFLFDMCEIDKKCDDF